MGLKPSQTKPKIYGTVPTNRHTSIPNDYGPMSACFEDEGYRACPRTGGLGRPQDWLERATVCTADFKAPNSAELKGLRKLLRIRPEICDFEPDLGLKRSQTKPHIYGTVPTNRRTTIPNDYGPMSAPGLGDCIRLCGSCTRFGVGQVTVHNI